MDPEASLREALASVHQYLSDSIPPLTVAPSVTLLLEQDPALVAGEIGSWITAQYGRAGPGLSVSDYVFHTLKKLHELGQLKLVPIEPLRSYLESLRVLVLGICPEGERDLIGQSLDALERTETVLSPAIGFVHRRVDAIQSREDGVGADAESVPDGFRDVEAVRRGRRFSLLIERLQRKTPTAAEQRTSSFETSDEQLSRTLAAAASNAQTKSEFQQIQQALMMVGAGSGADQVLRRLSSSLPAWYVSLAPMAGTGDQPAAHNPALAAMLRIMRLAEGRPEAGKRYQEIVQAGVEQFNAGSLGKAVTMLELADSMVAEGNVDADIAGRTRASAHESLDFNRLRVCAEKPETHFLLKRLMRHFDELTPESLLGRLRVEPKRDRRRMILSLLEAHGQEARRTAFQQLEEEAGAGSVAQSWYFPRNLICVLSRIAPEEEADLDKEVALVGSLLKLSYPAPLVREAITYLGQIHHGAEEQLLLNLLGEVERRLLETDRSDPESARLQSLLDRVISVLARYGTPRAYRAVIDHGLTRREDFGDTLARLAGLAGEDLSGEKEGRARLLTALKARTPLKLLGIVIHKDVQDPLHLIKALSSTPAPEVRQAFEHIARNFPNHEFGRAASRALKGFSASTRSNDSPTERLLGDLDLLSLPDLLQQLARSRLTGTLTLKDQRGEPVGTVSLQRGFLTDSRTGALEGRAAVYQLLLRPVPGTFVFTRRKSPEAGEQSDRPPGQELAPLVQEATRRYDELQRARALVPDGCRLKPTGAEPRLRPDEEDPALFRRVWTRVCSGAGPDECEADSPADAFQIRLLLARWVEDAVLTTQ